MTVRDIIQQKIQLEGPIPFDQFMEMALYYPDLGYYHAARNPIGSAGDYYTIPHITPVFGAMIARQLQEMWEILGQPSTFHVIEVGGGNGHLCRSIITQSESMPGFVEALKYIIVERSPAMIQRAKAIVPSCVQIFESVDALPLFTGCVLSNELFDNIPFSIMMQKEELMEVFVDYDVGFFETLRPASNKISNLVKDLYGELPADSRTEISFQSLESIRQLSVKLQKGFMLHADYGFAQTDFLVSGVGTLTCFYRHLMHHNPFIHLGDQDITCRINFYCLSQFGNWSGLKTAGYVCQANFLRCLGLVPFILEKVSGYDQSKAVSVLTNLLLENTNKFKVLIQYKGLPLPRLTGLALREPVKW